MNNKVLVKVSVPELGTEFDIFIPVNEIVWKIKKMLIKSISDITSTPLTAEEYMLINKDNSKVYKNNEIIINSDIRNTTELILCAR